MGISTERLRVVADYIKTCSKLDSQYDPLEDLQELLGENEASPFMYHGMPLDENVIEYFAEMIQDEDTAIAAVSTEKTHVDTTKVVGVCTIVTDLTPEVPGYSYKASTQEKFWIPIVDDDAGFHAARGIGHLAAPSACFTRFVNNNFCITINSTFAKIAKDPNMFPLANAIMAHEIGHYLAGHFDPDKEKEVKKLNNWKEEDLFNPDGSINFVEIARGLLHDGIYEIEKEADRYGMALVGMPDILAMLLHQIHTVPTLGVRTEFENRVKHHVTHIDDPDYIPEIGNITFGWYVLTDKELKELRKGKREAIKTVIENKKNREK